MNIDIVKGNSIALQVTTKYQNIPFRDTTLKVPYFINTAEQVYKQVMREAGIETDLIKKAIQLIKDGKTPLGSTGGKGSPEQITADLARLVVELDRLSYSPTDPEIMRKWMVEMHVGLDCSGYIYNILTEIEKEQKTEILKLMAWADPETMKPSHAGAFIFDSEQLGEVTNYADLMPLDLLVTKDHTHIGILVELDSTLQLADCSMARDGITVSKIHMRGKKVLVDGYDRWTNYLRDGDVVVRRLQG